MRSPATRRPNWFLRRMRGRTCQQSAAYRRRNSTPSLVVAAISARARENEVVLIRRSAAMRYVAEQQAAAGRSRFELQNRGYHCTAEHVGLVVRLSLERFAGTK